MRHLPVVLLRANETGQYVYVVTSTGRPTPGSTRTTSTGTRFSTFTVDDFPLVRPTTDHPAVFAKVG